jgi:hypothetical protein
MLLNSANSIQGLEIHYWLLEDLDNIDESQNHGVLLAFLSLSPLIYIK